MSRDFKGSRPSYLGTNLALVTDATATGLMNVVEVDLGSTPRRAGHFDITTTGLTVGQNVIVEQINGPYTNKGTLADEAEMDQLTVTGQAISTTVIRCYWTSPTHVRGNIKFAYTLVSTLNTVPSATDSTPGLVLADLLSLRTAEASITGAVTLTSSDLGKMHVCSGTSADYTVTLPAASGNSGKAIGFRGASALTKNVTVNGMVLNALEIIVLYSTESEWVAIADTRPKQGFVLNTALAYSGAPGAGTTTTSGDLRGATFGVPNDAKGVWIISRGYNTTAGEHVLYDSADVTPTAYSPAHWTNQSFLTTATLPVRLGTGANAGKIKVNNVNAMPLLEWKIIGWFR